MAEIRILLIEDDPAYARLIERMLGMSPVGFRVTVADRLTSALSELYKGRFNLILTDLNLPDISGLDTIDALRSTEALLPIIVLTGIEDEGLGQQAVTRGAQLYLQKSDIETKTLLDAMHQAVRISRDSSQSSVEKSSPSTAKNTERLLSDLEENIVAVKGALALLDNAQLPVASRDAVHTIRSHIGKMQTKIGGYRRSDG